HGALALIFERHEQIHFVGAPQHSRIPGPVEKDGPQVLRTGRRGVRRRSGATSSATTTATTASSPLRSTTLCRGSGRSAGCAGAAPPLCVCRHSADCKNDPDRDNRLNDASSNSQEDYPLFSD